MSRAAEPAGETDSARAVGRLAADGPWVGFARAHDGYRLVFGRTDGTIRSDPTTEPGERRAGLLAAAISFFLASLADPPAELEATQSDMARLVSALVATGPGDTGRGQEALDAIDDGLPGDAVALCLQRLLPPDADALAILRARARLTIAEGPPAAGS